MFCSLCTAIPIGPADLVKNSLKNIWYFHSCIWKDKHQKFFPASPELAGILPSCVTSSKLKLWDDQQCHSGDGWNDILLILNHFNCPIAKYKVIEEGSLACKSLLLSFSSPVSAGCQTCFAYQGSMSLEERTWWETAIFYFSWHICLSIFKKWNVNCSYYHL